MAESETRTPRVDVVIGEYSRKGKCQVCEGSCERVRTIRGATYQDMDAQAQLWMKEPLKHKRCE